MFERSKPFTYKIVSSMSIGENGTWDPSASPVLSLCSVTIVSGKVKQGQHPSRRVGAGPPASLCLLCLDSAGRSGAQHKASVRHLLPWCSLFLLSCVVVTSCVDYFLCVLSQLERAQPSEEVVHRRLLVMHCQVSCR